MSVTPSSKGPLALAYLTVWSNRSGEIVEEARLCSSTSGQDAVEETWNVVLVFFCGFPQPRLERQAIRFRNVCLGSFRPRTLLPATIRLYIRQSADFFFSFLGFEVKSLPVGHLSAAPRSPFVRAPRLANLRAMVELNRFSPPSFPCSTGCISGGRPGRFCGYGRSIASACLRSSRVQGVCGTRAGDFERDWKDGRDANRPGVADDSYATPCPWKLHPVPTLTRCMRHLPGARFLYGKPWHCEDRESGGEIAVSPRPFLAKVIHQLVREGFQEDCSADNPSRSACFILSAS